MREENKQLSKTYILFKQHRDKYIFSAINDSKKRGYAMNKKNISEECQISASIIWDLNDN